MKSFTLFIFILLCFISKGLSQAYADFTIQVSPQYSKFDHITQGEVLPNSFCPGLFIGSELGVFFCQAVKLTIGYGYALQENTLQRGQYPFIIESDHHIFAGSLDYTFLKDKQIRFFTGSGFQLRKKRLEHIIYDPSGHIIDDHLGDLNHHILIRAGGNYYFYKNAYLRILLQAELPVLKSDVSNATLIGAHLGIGIKFDVKKTINRFLY
ncbi:MAG: hypothetical protein KDC85_15430 [Saprospiraceae bacterium]|nr:hypothetical protein [Saprospiraceae bacterium]MCB9323437.1 hypothetical protein [Lewinellaceae bacterium]